MQRCPLCRARLRGAAVCPRCEADLERAQRAEHSARALELQALEALLCSAPDAADAALAQAETLHRHPMQPVLAEIIKQARAHPKAPRPADDTGESQAPATDLPPIQPRHWWI